MTDPADPQLAPDGLTADGSPLHPGLPLRDLARFLRGLPAETAAEARNRALRAHTDPLDLASAGWAVIFARDADPAVREALSPLLALRREQASARDERLYREISGGEGVQPGETATDFLVRQGVLPGTPADPRNLPYYLLLVGGPGEIPWDFQHQLDVQYAVGRLRFDTPEEHAAYARAVLEAESRPPGATPRRAVFFGVECPGDDRTRYLRELLTGRLAAAVASGRRDWTVETTALEAATKERLGRLLSGGPESPALLFASGHGMGFLADDPRQRSHQGALVCRDWPGRGTSLAPEHYFSADDLPAGARPAGLIAVQYSCHGAGTPRFDSYDRSTGAPRELAREPFTARLPQRLLASGALAFVGHVERTWGYSFLWKGVGSQPTVVEDFLLLLLEGQPIGAALEGLGQRTGDLAASFLGERYRPGGASGDLLTRLWTAAQDARTFVLLGDPAVRLPGARPAGPPKIPGLPRY